MAGNAKNHIFYIISGELSLEAILHNHSEDTLHSSAQKYMQEPTENKQQEGQRKHRLIKPYSGVDKNWQYLGYLPL